MMKFHAWFECFAGCGVRYDLEQIVYRCESCGGLLEVRHDLGALAQRPAAEWTQLFDSRMVRTSGVWSKKEIVLPELEAEKIVSLGEGNSPLIKSERFAKHLGVAKLNNPAGNLVAFDPVPDFHHPGVEEAHIDDVTDAGILLVAADHTNGPGKLGAGVISNV